MFTFTSRALDSVRTDQTGARRGRRAATALAAATLVLAACGGSDDSADEPEPAPAEEPAAEPEPAPEPADEPAEAPEPAAAISTASSDLGDHLVDAGGMTLYGFTPDADGVPTCEGDCADAWPPVLFDEVPDGLDPAVFSVVDGPNGSQLKAGKWPLYRFAADIVPGDVTGQEQGGVWFVVAPDGALIGADMTAMDDGAMDDAGDEAAADSVEITIQDFAFSGATTATPGATLVVSNVDGAPHTITADDGAFDTGTIDGGGSATITLPTEPGTYTFFCAIHPSMTGEITIG